MGNGTTDLAADFVDAMGEVTNASGYLTNSLESFGNVMKRVEQRMKELDEKEKYLKDMEKVSLFQKILYISDIDLSLIIRLTPNYILYFHLLIILSRLWWIGSQSYRN